MPLNQTNVPSGVTFGYEVPGLSELVQGAAKALTWRLVAVAADMVTPGAGQLVRGLRTGMKVVKIGQGLTRGDGVQLSAGIQTHFDISIELSTTIGAEHRTPFLGVEPAWSPMPAESRPAVEFGIEAGRAADRAQAEQPVDVDTRLYELKPPPTAGGVRAGIVESIRRPGLTPVTLRTELTGLAMTAPVRDVPSRSRTLSARSVMAYAESVGAAKFDSSTNGWYVDLGSRSGLAAYSRRRRINTVAYRAAGMGFVAVVELALGKPPAFSYLILDAEAVPGGLTAGTLGRRPGD